MPEARGPVYFKQASYGAERRRVVREEFRMPQATESPDGPLKAEILTLLNENRVLSLATVRPDGWPQVTMVGYVHDDIALYFSVARTSQKFRNIQRDPRVSIAIGHDTADQIRGLSMSARVFEVTDPEEVARLNAILAERYPEQAVFAPREASSALLKATPKVISIVNLPKGPGPPRLVAVESETVVRPLDLDPDSQASVGASGPAPNLG
jgi:uncharacterized pyridoxamine 5'-phosphate oxidase family protein